MTGYTKLFSQILDSTVWREDDHARILWITMLAMADRDGIVQSSIPGLADRARISIEHCEAGLKRFQQPDKYSKSKEDEGRRIRPIEGGWLLINHGKYRALMSREDQREKARIRKQNQRLRDSQCDTSHPVTPGHECHDIAKAEAEADADLKKKSISSNPDGLDAIVSAVFVYYLERAERNPKTYALTPARMRVGKARLKECLKKAGGDLDRATELMKMAVDALAASDWHMGRDPKTGGKRYCDWKQHLFKNYEKMEEWWNAWEAK
jgi:hypothetical protein